MLITPILPEKLRFCFNNVCIPNLPVCSRIANPPHPEAHIREAFSQNRERKRSLIQIGLREDESKGGLRLFVGALLGGPCILTSSFTYLSKFTLWIKLQVDFETVRY